MIYHRSRRLTLPVKIAFVCGQLGLGGAEQQLYYLLKNLDRTKFQPVVVNLGARSEFWEEPIQELGISIYHPTQQGVQSLRYRLKRIIRIAQIFQIERIGIAQGWDLNANFYAAVASRLSNVAICLGAVRSAPNFYKTVSDKLLLHLGIGGLDGLVVNSATAAEQLKTLNLIKANMWIVSNGVEIHSAIDENMRNRLREELGLSKQVSVIGTIGRLDSNKNHAMLIRSFAVVARSWPELELLIIGDGILKTKLIELTQQLDIADRVHFTGNIPYAARYLPVMDVYCMTSYTEGTPNVVMEASSAGLPVVSTPCGDSIKLIEHEVTGYLVDHDDDQNAASSLDYLLRHPHVSHKMGQLGRKKMQEEYSIDLMVSKMTQIYANYLRQKGCQLAL